MYEKLYLVLITRDFWKKSEIMLWEWIFPNIYYSIEGDFLFIWKQRLNNSNNSEFWKYYELE